MTELRIKSKKGIYILTVDGMCTKLHVFLQNFQALPTSHTCIYVHVHVYDNSWSSYTMPIFIHQFYSYIEQLYCNFLPYRVRTRQNSQQTQIILLNKLFYEKQIVKWTFHTSQKAVYLPPPPPSKIPYSLFELNSYSVVIL